MDGWDRVVLKDVFNIAAHADELPWKYFREGVEIIPLYGEPMKGPAAALLKYAPGAGLPYHQHAGNEVIVVLAGVQSDERGDYPQGTLIMNPAGTGHRVANAPGSIVLVVWEKPVIFPPASQDPGRHP